MPIILYEALAFVIPFDVVSLCMLYLMRFGLVWLCGIEKPLLDAETEVTSPIHRTPPKPRFSTHYVPLHSSTPSEDGTRNSKEGDGISSV